MFVPLSSLRSPLPVRPSTSRIDGEAISCHTGFMRLSVDEAEAIREEIRNFDADAEIYLHGSRADDSSRGGDIDLLVLSDKLGFLDTVRLRIAILDRIGWQQLDLVVRRPHQVNEPLATVMQETGVRL